MLKYTYIKSFFDLFLSLIMITAFLPLMLLVFLILIIDINEFPFFIQKRPGFKGKVFHLYKFKTMKSTRDKKGNLLPDFERITRLGKFLRFFSIDELPQLFNILKFEMSFVGPRPLLIEYLPLYTREQMRRHDVLPGISGYAQVNGRNSITWREKFELDNHYVENQSFFLDIKILIYTISKVISGEGINSDLGITMEKFNGEN